MRRGVPLLADLLNAYAGEGLVAISFTANNPELRAFVQKHNLKNSIALMSVNDTSNPYVHIRKNGFTHIFIIDRNGKIRWCGDYVVKEKEFLKALWKILNEEPVPSLEKALDPALDPAVSLYCDGLFAKAEKAALKIRNKYGKKKDPASLKIVEEADYLSGKIGQVGEQLFERLEEAKSSGSGIPFIKALDMLVDGFAKTDRADKARSIEKLASKDKNFGLEIKAARAWLALLDKYQLLFPIEKNAAARSFCSKIKKFTKTYAGLSAADEAEKMLARLGEGG
jgi:hypothetical protein